MVRIGGSVTVERDEVVKGDVVVIGGSADVDGEVTGDVNVVGGSLTLGPTALVRQNVAIVGGTLHRDPAARVLGKVDEVGVGGRFGGKRPNWRVERSERRSFGIGVFGTLLRGALMALIALIVVTLGRRHVEALSARVAAEPVRAGLVGLLAEIGFAPVLVVTIVVLAISIIGIPLLLLLPFALVLVVMLSLVGYTGVAAHVGEVVSRRLGLAPGVHATVAIGVAALVVVTLLGKLAGLAGGVFGGVVGGTLTFVGYLVEYLAWTLGLGGVILTWLQSRRKPTGFGQASSTAAASDAPPPEILGDDIPPFQRG